MVDRKRSEASLRRAHEILRLSPAERERQQARQRAEHERVTKELARLEVRRMIERSRALDEIDEALDRLEEQLSWLLYGKSRGAR